MERFEIRIGESNLNDFVFPTFANISGEIYKGYGIYEEDNYCKVICLTGAANGVCIAEVKSLEEAKWLIDKIIYKIGAAPIDADNEKMIKEYILMIDKSKKYFVLMKNNEIFIMNSYFDADRYLNSISNDIKIIESNLTKIEALKLADKLYKDNNVNKYSDKKFYEFSYENFGYYSLIAADDEEEAIRIFEKQVCDNEYGNYPEEVDKEYVIKMLAKYKDAQNEIISIDKCLLILAEEN